MKKFFATVVLAVAVTTASIANDITVNQRVISAFQKEFSSAYNPKWEMVGNGIYHAKFLQDNQIMDAYFNEEGELISFARYISAEQLPLLISKAIREKFADLKVKHVHEFVLNNETSYLVTLESDKKIIDARVFNSGGVQIINKTVKKTQE